MMRNTFSLSLLIGAGMALIALPAASLELDFAEFGHGDVITSSQGVTITTTNIGGGPDLGVAFDSNLSGTRDRDLERGSGFSGGNAAGSDFGNLLIIQENNTGCATGTCSAPDDEGSRPAGSIALDFSSLGSFDEFSFVLVDVESVTAEDGRIDFLSGGTEVASRGFTSFPGGGSGVSYGDNSANLIDVLSGISFDEVLITLGGSGGIGEIVVGNGGSAPVPEPSAALLFGLGAAVAGTRIRRA